MTDELPRDGESRRDPVPDEAEETRLDSREPSSSRLTVGNYRILQTLGEGGMGTVYLAEQVRPVRRRVGLKVIKLGMDSTKVVARFESERQALALMNHPNIARIYDAGTTPEGQPYFAMEYVEGQPINRYCDQRRLDLAARLELFVQVCEGVQHAHQKGIIHRDLKPSNVLVREQDDQRVVKIIDFGVAKATAQPLTERTYYTELGQLIGTPEYMSPEQAEMTGMDIDTRTDVYQLGVMLYELLTGRLPFPAQELRETGFSEFRRRILEVEPRRPSLRVAGEAEAARARVSEPHALSRRLRGDLDWITMKALEKDRMRRYAAASELAADVRRHLNHEPVAAGPPSKLYRVRKFARRNRAGVAFGAVLLVLLVGFATAMAVQVELLDRARNVASQEAEAAARARDRASQEADGARQVSEFLVSLFNVSDPLESRDDLITARDLLDRGVEQIESLDSQPLAQARLMDTMGQVYLSLGLHTQARPLLERALRIRERELGDHLDVAETMESLAGLLHLQLGEWERGLELGRRALEIRKRVLGLDHAAVASGMDRLGSHLATQGNLRRAVELFEQALEIRERVLPPDHPDIADSLDNHAAILKLEGQYDEALPLLERALRIRRAHHGSDHPEVAESARHLAGLYELREDWATARRHREEELRIHRAVYGEEHPRVAAALMALALVDVHLGERQRADAAYRQAAQIQQQAQVLQAPLVLFAKARYAALVGRREQALRYLREAVVERRYSDGASLRRDPHLASLRGDPEFESIVAEASHRSGG